MVREIEKGEKMPERGEEDMVDLPHILVKPLILAIPTDDEEFQELKEDLRAMGCAGLLARPWNVQSDDMLREFLFMRGNQWDGTRRRDPKNWTPDTWAKVYGFQKIVKEGWAGRKDNLFTGKFKGEVDPKESLHPANCLNLGERRMLQFMMPILNPEKPKWITLTMPNTLFEALFRVPPVNWGLFIHETVARAIPYIGRKPSYISPSIMHLYSHYRCTTVDEDDMLICAAVEIAYSLQPVAQDTNTSSDRPIPEAHPSSPGSRLPSSRRPDSPPSSLSTSSSSVSERCRAQPDTCLGPMAKRGFVHVAVSGQPLPTGVCWPGGSPYPVLPVGAKHQGSQPNPEWLRPWKHPPRVGWEGGPSEEGVRTGQDGKHEPQCTCVRYGSGVEPEEWGDPDVPRRAGGGLQTDPGTDRTTGQGCQQSLVVWPTGGIWRQVTARQTIPILMKYSGLMNTCLKTFKGWFSLANS